MSHSLSPLRQVYDLGEPPGRSDGAAAVEGEMLAQMRRLLEAAPRSRPEPTTLRAVEGHAEAALPFGTLRGTAAADSVEAQLLQQSAAALDALPPQAPDASVLDAVLARAAEASAELAPLRAAYQIGDAAPAGDVETELLIQTRAALDKTWTAQRPSPEAVDAVLARAASWTAEAVGATTAPSVAAAYGLGAPLDTPEAALVAGSADALDRLPVHRPSDDALAAVFAAAATATAAARPSPGVPRAAPAAARPSASRAAARPAALWARRPALWGGAFATLLAVVVAFGINQGEPELAAPSQDVAAAMPLAPEPEAAAAADRAPLPPLPDPAPAPSAGARALAAGGPMAGPPVQASTLAPPVAALAVVPAPARPSAAPAARREAAPVPASRSRAVPAAASPASVAEADALGFASAALAEDATPAAGSEEWDTPHDVRLLSLRLQELRRKNEGLAWDGPAEPFGAPAASAPSVTPGLQSVGGARAVPRARALVDTTIDR